MDHTADGADVLMDDRLVKVTETERFQGRGLSSSRMGRTASVSDLDEQRLRELDLRGDLGGESDEVGRHDVTDCTDGAQQIFQSASSRTGSL